MTALLFIVIIGLVAAAVGYMAGFCAGVSQAVTVTEEEFDTMRRRS